MKIQICEDNGFMNGGTPTLVVLVVTKDDGSSMRIPYKADKTIQEIYQELRHIDQDAAPKMKEEKNSFYSDLFNDTKQETKDIPNKNEIELEDIAECVKVNERDHGIGEDMIPVVGREYRIVNIVKQDKQVLAYEVLDDSEKTRIRIPMFPSELKLKRKRKPTPPRVMLPSEILKCTKCSDDVAAILDRERNAYIGKCEKCHVQVIRERAQPVTV